MIDFVRGVLPWQHRCKEALEELLDRAAFKRYIYHPLRVFIFWATENLGLLPMVKDLSSQPMIKKKKKKSTG